MNLIFESKYIRAGGKTKKLARQENIKLTYLSDGKEVSIDDYLERTNGTSLLVIKDGRIVFEQYANGNREDHAASSRSMAKSITSMVAGMAVKDGSIGSIDDPVVKYLPELNGTAYETVTLKHLLTMSSGVRYYENAKDPASDLTPLQGCLLANRSGCLIRFLRDLASRPNARVAPPGEKFHYSTADSVAMGIVVERAVGMPVTEYLSQKLWIPFGMERDAYWNVESQDGNYFGGSGFGATLRDYGRLGLFLLHNGRIDGEQVLPDIWVKESTTPSPAREDYGYYWWLDHGNAAFSARGSSGQRIAIVPGKALIIVKTSAALNREEDQALLDAIIQHFDAS
ncbi:serine hydrolase [Orrella sp. JC864]|uniref:serine hydrolase domain-containing protein n=1 Tax=Orrella sp. JC864 TaxID=3120298 RepID=UPI00300979A7